MKKKAVLFGSAMVAVAVIAGASLLHKDASAHVATGKTIAIPPGPMAVSTYTIAIPPGPMAVSTHTIAIPPGPMVVKATV